MKKYFRISVLSLFLCISFWSCSTTDSFEEIAVEEVLNETEATNGSNTGSGVGNNPPPPGD